MKKFLLYTNPNNISNRAYVAIGAETVNRVIKSSRTYPDSYQLLYGPVKGKNADLQKAKQMYKNYQFGNEVI